MKTVFEPQEIDSLAGLLAERLLPVFKEMARVEADKEDRWLTPDQLATLLSVKKAQVYAWVNESKNSKDGIPFLKSGKFLRFSEKEVLQWMRNGKKKCMREGD
jgi:excisionase family DNA binding protein